MSAQSRKMSAQFRPLPMMSAQSTIISSQSTKSVIYVRPISSAPHDVRAIADYLLSIHQICHLCTLNPKRCPPNFLRTPRCPRNPLLSPLNPSNPSLMSAQPRKMSAQFRPLPMMSAQSLTISSQSIKFITYVRSIPKDVRPISSAPHDVRAIADYLLSIHQIPQLCPLNPERSPPNLPNSSITPAQSRKHTNPTNLLHQ